MIKTIDGGICAAKGFSAAGIHCGIRKNRDKRDLALIVSEKKAAAAAAPIAVTKKHIGNGFAQAVICNSGNANTCNADGIEIAEKMCGIVEKETGIEADDVIVASTGVIGQRLDIAPIENGAAELCAALGKNSGDAAEAIMTTDTVKKASQPGERNAESAELPRARE